MRSRGKASRFPIVNWSVCTPAISDIMPLTSPIARDRSRDWSRRWMRLQRRDGGCPPGGEMSKAQALAFAGLALLLGACSGWPRGAGFGLFGGAPAMPATASIDLDSEPQGAEAKTSAGGSCQTPCTLEVPTGGGFSVTFAREGFAPQTVAVQVQPDQE